MFLCEYTQKWRNVWETKEDEDLVDISYFHSRYISVCIFSIKSGLVLATYFCINTYDYPKIGGMKLYSYRKKTLPILSMEMILVILSGHIFL